MYDFFNFYFDWMSVRKFDIYCGTALQQILCYHEALISILDSIALFDEKQKGNKKNVILLYSMNLNIYEKFVEWCAMSNFVVSHYAWISEEPIHDHDQRIV